MEEGKIGEIKSRSNLRIEVLRDIEYLLSKGLVSEKEIYYLIKSFLKDYLSLDYEFTKEELISELKNVYLPYNIRADFFKFIDEIFVFEYSASNSTDDELRQLLKEFRRYIDYLLFPQDEKGKKESALMVFIHTFRARLVSYLKSSKSRIEAKHHKKKQETQEETRVNVESHDLQALDPDVSKHIDINSLIEKVYYSLNNKDSQSALFVYKDVVNLYNHLSTEEKVKYYDRINSLYKALTKYN